MTLSEHIKLKWKKNGLSQIELAERAGVGLRSVRELEQGKLTLRMDKEMMCLPCLVSILDLKKLTLYETGRYIHQ